MEAREYIEQTYVLEEDVGGVPKRVKGLTRPELYRCFASLGYKVGAEIGVQRGRNAGEMFKKMPDLKLYLVEPYADYWMGNRWYGKSIHDKFRKITHERLKSYDTTYLEMFSEDAVREVPDDSLDFVYLDGMHLYDSLMLDIILWSRKVRKGGIVAGHDYYKNRNVIEVIHAVNDYVKEHKLPLYVTDCSVAETSGDKSPSWFFIKPAVSKIIGKVKDCS